MFAPSNGAQSTPLLLRKSRLEELRPITAYRSVPEVPQIMRAESSAATGLHTGEPVKRAAVPFTAFCAAAVNPAQTDDRCAGYRVMGLPGKSRGYSDARSTYGRRMSDERTSTGSLP